MTTEDKLAQAINQDFLDAVQQHVGTSLWDNDQEQLMALRFAVARYLPEYDSALASVAAAQRVPDVPVGWKLAPVEATLDMVQAYLRANDAYWHRTDALPDKLGVWRQGTPIEATTESYRAMLYAAPPAPAAEPAGFDTWQRNPYTKVLQDSIARDYVLRHEAAAEPPTDQARKGGE